MKLRDYQHDAIAASIAALRAHKRTLVCMPTGTGKTVTFAELASMYLRAKHRALVLAHREELLDQAAEKLERCSGVMPTIEQGARGRATGRQLALDESPLVVGSVFSMINRLDRFPAGWFQLVIVDEAHHALAPTYLELIKHFDAKTIGFTATPNRGDEKALAQVFDSVAYDMTLADAITSGWLVPPRFEQINVPGLNLDAVRKRSGELALGDLERVLTEVAVLRGAIGPALKHAAKLKTLGFCATRAHMHCVAECARGMAKERSIKLEVLTIDGTTPSDERARIMARFREPKTKGKRWLLGVDVPTEGFDVPDIEALLMLRPTIRRSIYMQMIGRGLRPLDGLVDDVSVELLNLATGYLATLRGRVDDLALARRVAIAMSTKPQCLILDFAGNSTRHELASPLDLLGGDFDPIELNEAKRLVGSGLAPDLWTALEMVRARLDSKALERMARAGDPFALFGVHAVRSRWGEPPTDRQRAVVAALRSPRQVDDYREANALCRELARRDGAGLALYSQAALLARLGHPLGPLRTMSRREAAAVIRRAAAQQWKLD